MVGVAADDHIDVGVPIAPEEAAIIVDNHGVSVSVEQGGCGVQLVLGVDPHSEAIARDDRTEVEHVNIVRRSQIAVGSHLAVGRKGEELTGVERVVVTTAGRLDA
ncbi:MAG: hypothetical protein IH988_08530 [Planctomycetes bacterium]|nr:hypothetical protein [Planctomycetota bacterium]